MGQNIFPGEPSLTQPDPEDYATLSKTEPPRLIVGIDTEAEFDWGRPFSRTTGRIRSIAEQYRAQEIFEKYGVVPTYLVDFAVANDDDAVRILSDLRDAGRCAIGAHLNPWLNPPFDEPLDRFHSYPCNLPAQLERQKLERLTTRIAEQFGESPRVYRAGRYGIGAHTGQILEDLDYRVDMSVVPCTPFDQDGGPNFERFDNRLFWFGPAKNILEIPVSSGYAGWLSGGGKSIFPPISGAFGMRLHLPGIFARLRALERIRLTPEGVNFEELCRLTESLLGIGCRVFSLTYHSPSLVPGNTPYVRDIADREELLARIERYVVFFKDSLGGKISAPMEIYDRYRAVDRV